MAINSEATDAATVARGYFEAVGRRDLDAMTAFYEPGGTGEIYGLVELRRARQLPGLVRRPLPTPSPTSSIEIVEVVAAGEKAAVRWRATGTFDGTAQLRRAGPQRRPRSTSRAATC